MRPQRYVAGFDSATALLRGLAACLRGRPVPAAGINPALRPLLPAVARLPAGLQELAYTLGGWSEAVPAGALGRVRAGDLAAWAAGQYPRRRYPAVLLGSANGAAAHLGAALGAPWLPQTFLVPVRRGRPADPADFAGSMRWALEPGRRLLGPNPDLQLHHMHDPNQDWLMIRMMAYFRVKYRRLPAAYERFITRVLAPGGTLAVVDCARRWPSREVSERHYFQPGAMGGLPPAGYLRSGEQVAGFLRRRGSARTGWEAPPPDGERPEAEWGFEPRLAGDAARLARERGYRLRFLRFEDPEDLSPLVADLYRWWYRRRGLPAGRLVVEQFFLAEPALVLATASVPFWLKFSVEPDAAALERYLRDREPFADVRIALFSHGVESVGVAAPDRWREVLSAAAPRWSFLGTDPARFPRDFLSLRRFHEELARLPRPPEPPAPLSLAELDGFLEAGEGAYPVAWTGSRTGGR